MTLQLKAIHNTLNLTIASGVTGYTQLPFHHFSACPQHILHYLN